MAADSSEQFVLLNRLADEFAARYRSGERPALQEYIDRHPELADDIREFFPALAQMEQVKEDRQELSEPAAAGPLPPLERLGDFRIIREIGHGGMGVVYEAEQVSLGRHVALKVLPKQLLVDARTKRRFDREAKAAARLHHTNIVPVFGVGEHEGLPYYVMQFIPGLGLDEVLEELNHLQPGDRGDGSSPRRSAGELRVSRREVSAPAIARSLLTGQFAPAAEGVEQDSDPARARPDGNPAPHAEAPGAPPEATVDVAPSPLLLSPENAGEGNQAAALPPWEGARGGGEEAAPPAHTPVAGRLSDSFSLSSSSVVLPGAARQPGQEPPSYWQSVARIGVQVADALEYAHRQGILHRDIKPSNLLLDTRGTVWVTDFGLAKADDQPNLTHTGDVLGTLRYMPPEAFEGRADARGDVYSLGLTLYELLCLRPAFDEKERNRLIKQVTTEEPPRLERLNREVPRDLVTIVHKAIDRERIRRYPTAAELAADLQCFIDDEPIQARRVTIRERTWRWCRHNPALAATAAAAVLLLVGVAAASMAAAFYFDRLARAQAQVAEQQQEAAEQERTVRARAEQAREREAALRADAEASFSKSLAAVDEYFTRVSETRLLKEPGMQELRRDLLRSAVSFYQDFVRQRGSDPALRAELAASLTRVARIDAEVGSSDQAREPLERAIGLLHEAARADPARAAEFRTPLATAQSALGDLDRLKRPAAAQQAYLRAARLYEELVNQPAGESRTRQDLATVYARLAETSWYVGQPGRATEYARKALALREELALARPDDPEALRGVGNSLNDLSVMLSRVNRTDERLDLLRPALDLLEQAFERDPTNPLYEADVAIGRSNVATCLGSLERWEEATREYTRAVSHLAAYCRANPSVRKSQNLMFDVLNFVTGVPPDRGPPEAVRDIYRQVRDLFLALPKTGHQDHLLLARARASYARSLERWPTPGKSTTAAEEAEYAAAVADIQRAAAAELVDSTELIGIPQFRPLLGRADFQAVVNKIGQRAMTPQAAASADARRNRLRAGLAATYLALGLAALADDKSDRAKVSFERASELYRKLVREEPNDARHRAGLACLAIAAGKSDWVSGRLADGRKQWREGLSELDKVADRKPPIAELVERLAHEEWGAANGLASAGLWEEAAALAQRSFARFPGRQAPDWYAAAVLLRLAGDDAGYRRHRDRMAERFRDSTNPGVLGNLLRTFLLDPDETRLLASLGPVVDRCEASEPQHAWLTGYLVDAYRRLNRADRALQVAARLDLSAASGRPFLPTVALAHFQAGEKDQALARLRQADAAYGQVMRFRLRKAGINRLDGWYPDLEWSFLARRDAHRRITGIAADESLGHLEQALVRSWLNEPERVEAELQVASAGRTDSLAFLRARAGVFAQLGRHKNSAADLEKAMRLQPNNPEVWKERGQIRFAQGQTQEATADFLKAIELLGEKAVVTEQPVSEGDKLFISLADEGVLKSLTAALRRNPTDWQRLRKRGEWFARHARWKEAAADFRAALERQSPSDHWMWFHAAPVLVAGGDNEGYLWVCREMLKRFSETLDPPTAERVAKVCLLLPEVGQDRELAAKLADRAVTRGKNHPYQSYFVLCKGLAYFRCGNSRAAIETLDPLLARGASPHDVAAITHTVLAMARHKHGEARAARKHLAEAARLIEFYKGIPGLPLPPYHHDWLIATLLHREAATLIEGEKSLPGN